MKRAFLTSTACALVAGMATPALAQTGTTQATPDPQSAPVPQSTPEANAPQGAAVSAATPQVASEGLQDIIVTAQRVAESAQRAPIAISVVRPEELLRQNVVRPEDLARTVPALAAANAGGANTVFFVRGVGNFTVNAYSDPAVAFNYDGVYIGRPSSTGGTFYDLQRVEVLKGPQGTLYGRNATGGAINVIPNRPRVGETSAEFSASYGNYDTAQAQGAINLPIADTGAVRLSGTYARHDGYADDGTGSGLDYGARLQVLANLTPTLTARVSADYSHQGGNGTAATYLGDVRPNFGATGFTGYTFTPTNFKPDQGILSPEQQAYLASHFSAQAGRAGETISGYPYNNNSYWGILAEINWQTSAGTLTIQPAYREADLNNLFTQAGMNGAITDEHDQQFSLEARWAGSIGTAVDYLIGGFYFKEDIGSSVSFSQFVLTPFQDFTTGTKSYAGFGKVTAHLTPALSLTAAGRYTSDRKRFDGNADTYLLFCGNPAPPQDFCPTVPFLPLVRTAAELRAFYAARGIPITRVPLFALPPFVPGSSQTAPFVLNAPIPINQGLDADKFTYRLAAEYELGRSSMVYASFETGYHAGGFSFARGLETYKPETIDAYTVGSKNRFLNNRIQLNVEGYLWKYRNQQYSQFGFDLGSPPATVFLTRNIGNSTIYGVDVDTQILLTRNTLVSAAAQYLHTRYDSFVYVTPNQGLPPITTCGTTPGVSGGQAVYTVDCSGKSAFNSPKWSFNLNAQQTIPLDGYKLVLQGGTRYRSRSQVDPGYASFVYAKANFVSNASVTLTTEDERWFVSGFVTNIENSRRLVFDTQNQSTGIFLGNYEPPRTYGVRIGGKF